MSGRLRLTRPLRLRVFRQMWQRYRAWAPRGLKRPRSGPSPRQPMAAGPSPLPGRRVSAHSCNGPCARPRRDVTPQLDPTRRPSPSSSKRWPSSARSPPILCIGLSKTRLRRRLSVISDNARSSSSAGGPVIIEPATVLAPLKVRPGDVGARCAVGVPADLDRVCARRPVSSRSGRGKPCGAVEQRKGPLQIILIDRDHASLRSARKLFA